MIFQTRNSAMSKVKVLKIQSLHYHDKGNKKSLSKIGVQFLKMLNIYSWKIKCANLKYINLETIQSYN